MPYPADYNSALKLTPIRYGRQRTDTEIKPFVDLMHAAVTQARGERAFGVSFDRVHELRKRDQEIFHDYLADEGDPRSHLLWGDLHQRDEGSVNSIAEHIHSDDGHNAYELRKHHGGELVGGWWPEGLHHGFVSKLTPDQAHELVDSLPEGHRQKLKPFLDTHAPKPETPGQTPQ